MSLFIAAANLQAITSHTAGKQMSRHKNNYHPYKIQFTKIPENLMNVCTFQNNRYINWRNFHNYSNSPSRQLMASECVLRNNGRYLGT